jgi:hypothetical protein
VQLWFLMCVQVCMCVRTHAHTNMNVCTCTHAHIHFYTFTTCTYNLTPPLRFALEITKAVIDAVGDSTKVSHKSACWPYPLGVASTTFLFPGVTRWMHRRLLSFSPLAPRDEGRPPPAGERAALHGLQPNGAPPSPH